MTTLRPSEPTALVKVEAGEFLVTEEQRQSYAALYQSLFQPLVAFARRYVDRETASDLVHEALTDIWTRWTEGKIGEPSAPYIYRAVRNKIASAREHEYLEGFHLYRFLRQLVRRSRRKVADVAMERAELSRILDESIAAMPKQCRATWVLIRENGFTYDQAAQSLGISIHGAKANITRAQALLREALTDAGYRESALLANNLRHKLLPTPAAEERTDE
jgi:RNA polymerase sigma-70 factor (ECF subfamily)